MAFEGLRLIFVHFDSYCAPLPVCQSSNYTFTDTSRIQMVSADHGTVSFRRRSLTRTLPVLRNSLIGTETRRNMTGWWTSVRQIT